MTATNARLIVFGCWLGSLTICLMMLFCAVFVRADLGFQWSDAFQLATSVASLYIPVLTAFALFWFHPGNPPNNKKVNREKWIAALSLTLFFQLFMILGTAGIVLLSRRPSPDADTGLFEQISGLTNWISIFSPIATAPTAFMLGVEKIDISNKTSALTTKPKQPPENDE